MNGQSLMMPPDEMAARYGLEHALSHRATPAQRRRIRKKLRRIYGMAWADRRRWIEACKARGWTIC